MKSHRVPGAMPVDGESWGVVVWGASLCFGSLLQGPYQKGCDTLRVYVPKGLQNCDN